MGEKTRETRGEKKVREGEKGRERGRERENDKNEGREGEQGRERAREREKKQILNAKRRTAKVCR